MIFILLVIYLLEDKIKLSNLGFSLLGALFIFHNLGVFGLYNLSFLNIGYDKYLHFFSGIALAKLSFDFIGEGKSKTKKVVYVLILVLIFGLLHEAIESLGNLIFGKGEGFIFIGPGDLGTFDSYKDLLSDLLGGLFGLIIGKKLTK